MMLELDPQVTMWLALGACAAAALLAIVVASLGLRLRRLGRRQERAFGAAEGEDVLGTLGRHDHGIARLRDDVRSFGEQLAGLRDVAGGAVCQVGMIRYDAFEDMGGASSFSAALLDQRGEGIVLSAINGRTETRCYAKAVRGGVSDHDLSVEEEAAIATALAGGGEGETPVASGRRRRRDA
jgi:hypothetical protein